jgi:cyclopropane-fatty-acyl-phospholipid synthase
VIRLLVRFRLAWNVKKPSPHAVERRRRAVPALTGKVAARKPTRRGSEATLALLADLFSDYHPRDFAVRLWDGATWEPEPGQEARFTLVVNTPTALRALLRHPDELALAEAYVYGDLDFEGDLEAVFRAADHLLVEKKWSTRSRLRAARHLVTLSSNGARTAPPQRARLGGRRFTLARDRKATNFHYDRSNEFFALWLDERMLYTTAYFASPDETLERAQEAKLDYICRKLRLKRGERLLDIGCGWGALVVHAAERYGAEVVGITLSEEQAAWARERVERAGVADRGRVEIVDYRELEGAETFDKIAAVGMFEHVPHAQLSQFFGAAWRLLRPRGLFLNHAIARPLLQPPRRGRSFMGSYVYPDAELKAISVSLGAAEEAGFEVRDVESLREHYPPTLREWLRRLEESRAAVIAGTDETTYRVFRLYLAGSVHGFVTGRLNVYQSLLAKPENGVAGLPLQREDLYA